MTEFTQQIPTSSILSDSLEFNKNVYRYAFQYGIGPNAPNMIFSPVEV